MASNFDAALLRLKGALQVQSDKEVAGLLGMSPTALNDRKRRDAFPADKVRALSLTRHFDAEYVITGVAQAALEMIQAAREGKPLQKVSLEDQALLAHWHMCDPADQALMLQLIKRLSGGMLVLDESHQVEGTSKRDIKAARKLSKAVGPVVAFTAAPFKGTEDGASEKGEEPAAPHEKRKKAT